MPLLTIPASYYQQFDADYSRDVPGEGYGGWQRADIEIDPAHTAVVCMHAWQHGTYDEFPGWWRCVEYIPRAAEIARTVFPPLLAAVRRSPLPLFHVVGGGSYYKDYPGYKRAVALAGPSPKVEGIPGDPALDRLRAFRAANVFVGKHNQADVTRGFEVVDFPPEARPVGEEGIAEDGHQLFALCKSAGVSHLIYTGFAIEFCLLLSPGGMNDMASRGIMCSVIREATTAVECKETARQELVKQIGLWRVGLLFGFVFGVEDVIKALGTLA